MKTSLPSTLRSVNTKNRISKISSVVKRNFLAVLFIGLSSLAYAQPLEVSVTGTSATCNGSNNGSVSATAQYGSSPYSYLWSNAANTSSINSLSPGTYTVTVTDAVASTVTASYAVTEPTAIVVSIVSTNPLCSGDCNGTATASASGGSGGYSYLWSNSDNTSLASNLCAGVYSVTVTDGSGCMTIDNIILAAPSILIADAGVAGSDVTICLGGNVAIGGNASGGTAPYTYNWSPGTGLSSTTVATPFASPTSTTTFFVTVTDNNGCVATDDINVFVDAPPTVSAGIDQSVCADITSVNLNGNVTGGTSTGTWTTSGSGTFSPDATMLNATYIFAGADVGGGGITLTLTSTNNGVCSAQNDQMLVYNNPMPTISVLSPTNSNCGQNDGSVFSAIANGTPPYSYSWDNGGTDYQITGVFAGSYQLTVTDFNGCIVTGATAVSDNSGGTLTASTTTNVSCFGGNDGSALASMTGGTPSYTYNWSNGGNTSSITNLTAGTYSVTVIDANGCITYDNTVVTEPTAITVATSAISVTCFAYNDGSATAIASGGAGGFSYNWSNGAATATANTLIAGSYNVTVTDVSGCTATDNTVITEPSALTLTASGTTVYCNGGNDGTATAVASGGAGGFTYNWSNGGNTSSITNLTAGTYSVTVIDANGCISTDNTVITEPTMLTLTATSTGVSCNGGNNGTATATGTGGTGTITYSWDAAASFQNTATATSLAAGTYNVTATDANNCNTNTSVIVTQPNALTLLITSNDEHCGLLDGNATSTGGGGSTPYSYTWSNGATSSTVTGLASGTYGATVTDVNNCISTDVAIINSLNVIADAGIDLSTCEGGSEIIGGVPTATGGVTPYTYSWSPATGLNDPSLANPTAMPAITTNYTVTVTDAFGCPSVDVMLFDISPFAIVNAGADTSVCSGSTATINGTVIGGTTTGIWTTSGDGIFSPDNTSLSTIYIPGSVDINTGFATLVLTSTNNGICNAVGDTLLITINPAVTANISAANSNCGLADGSATVSVSTGTSPFSFNWSSGGSAGIETGLSAGSYNLTITDVNACSMVTTTNISDNGGPGMSITGISVTCNGDATGLASAMGTGGTSPYSYLWSNGATTNNAPGLAAGSYFVTVTDASSCVAVNSVSINEPTALLIAVTTTDVTVTGGNDGTASVTVSGGASPYAYLWNTSENLETIENLTAGSYSVTVIDGNNCEAVGNATITEPALSPMTIVLTESGPNLCFESCNAVIQSTVSGGATPYAYLWSNTQDMSFAENVCAGVIIVSVTDNLGATITESFTVTEPAEMILSFSVTDESSVTACDGAATVNVVSGGTSPYLYQWNNVQNPATITALCAGSYVAVVNDANGCQGVDSTSVQSGLVLLSVSTSVTDLTCAGICAGKIILSPTGGTAPYTYQWSNGANGSVMVGLCKGVYGYTVTDNLGQTDLGTVTVSAPSAITVSTSSTQSICGSNDGSVSVSVAGGISPYSYLWSNGITITSVSGLAGGSYAAQITDANDCKVTGTAVVGDVNGPTVLQLSVTAANCGGADGKIVVGAFGGASPYTYLWDNGVNGLIIMDATPGDHYVAVTDANGCVGSLMVAVDNVGGIAPTLSGNVTNLLDGLPITDGKVEVYGYNPYRSQMDIIASGAINTDGSYFIPQVLPIGQYFVVGRANNSLPQYQNTVPTFYGATYNWATAPLITASCNDQLAADIVIIDLTPLVGTGTIGGSLQWDGSNKNGKRAGDPIPGIDISLEQIPGGIIAFTQSGDDGKFQFDSIPTNSSDSTYAIYVNIPGLEVVQRYENISFTSEDSVNLGFNFLASDSTIYTDQVDAVQNRISVTKSSMRLYPNPFSDNAYIGYELKETANVSIEVYNVLGEVISTKNYGKQSAGKYSNIVDFGNSKSISGAYFVKMIIGNDIHTQQLLEIK